VKVISYELLSKKGDKDNSLKTFIVSYAPVLQIDRQCRELLECFNGTNTCT